MINKVNLYIANYYKQLSAINSIAAFKCIHNISGYYKLVTSKTNFSIIIITANILMIDYLHAYTFLILPVPSTSNQSHKWDQIKLIPEWGPEAEPIK